MRTPQKLAGIALLFAMVACQFERPRDVPEDAPRDAASAGVQIRSISASWVRIDGEAPVSVVIDRDPGMDGDVEVTLGAGARNLTAEPLILSGAATTGTLMVRASSANGVVPGPAFEVELMASTPTGSVSGVFDILVAGQPGQVDESFGVVGVAAISPGVPGGIFRQGDGVVVVSGDKLARFDRGGALDPLFGDGGVATPVFNGLVSAGRVFAAGLSTGRIIAVGNGHGADPDRYDVFLQRLTSGGVRDVTYVEHDEPLLDSFTVVTVGVAADDSLVVGGSRGGASSDVVIRKFDGRGVADTSFGVAGAVALSYGDVDLLEGMHVSSDGSIVVAASGGDEVVHISRWTPAGQPDGSFAGGGEVVLNDLLPGRPAFAEVWSLRVDGVGRILVSGWYSSMASLNFEAFVVRLSQQGGVDDTFGVGGVWSLTRTVHDIAASTVEVADGELLVGGATAGAVGAAQSGIVAHLTADGSLISDLGPTGVAELDFPFLPGQVAFADPASRGWYLGGAVATQPAVVRLWY